MLNDISKTPKFWAISSAALVFFLSGSEMCAQSGSDKFVSFDEFLSATAAAVYNSATMPKVANAAAFEEMRQRILKLDEGMHAAHSFAVGSQTYDCMPIGSQPAIRLLGLKGIAATPPAPKAPPSGAAGAHTSVLPPSGVDRFGNVIGCQDKTVPIGRTTLEQMTRFPTLQSFLRKSQDGEGKPHAAKVLSPGAFVSDAAAFQTIYNLGGSSTLSINDPQVDTSLGEYYSLSQVSYLGGDPTNGDAQQTVEAGWQVSPYRLGDEQPHLFAYYTADGYNQTGCYDYDCGAFVQYDGSLFLGLPLSPISVPGGEQVEVTILWVWLDGNWWLQVNGTWVGYYPGVLYGGGDLATHADGINDFGEFDCGFGTNYNYCPPMGSGYWGPSGYPYAAYQRQIWYFDGAYNANLATGVFPIWTCFGGTSMLGPFFDTVGDFGVYFFFGGPGGYC